MSFEKITGANKLYSIGGYFLLLVTMLLASFMFAKTFLSIAFVLVFIIAGILVKLIYEKPQVGVNVMFYLSFFVVGISRIKPMPLGLVVDSLMVLTWLVVFFKYFKKANWSIMKNSLTIGYSVWFLYCLLLVFNPEGHKVAYVYAVRDLALKSFLLTPILFLVYNKQNDYKHFINVWFGMSILLGLYGVKQYWIGVFGFEQYWLDTAGAKTHVLFGKFVRMFSFLASANQFGSSQAHVASVAIVFAITEKSIGRKLFYVFTSLICIYGMVISGTRASVVIPIVGILVYLVLSKNFKILITGSIIGGVLLYFLMFTYVMHSVEAVRRIRTTFDYENDASYIVRMENREQLKVYMASRPFGAGIGAVGDWGRRFTPNTFLGSFPTDGQYVKIYAETGVVGLWVFGIVHVVILINMFWIVWNLKDPKLRNEMTGLLAGVIAAHVVNHTSHFTGGLPTIIVNLFCFAFIYMSRYWDQTKDMEIEKNSK